MNNTYALRAQELMAQEAQEDRMTQLYHDNAFVNVGEVLRRQRRGGESGDRDAEVEFLEPNSALPSAPPRLHIGRLFLEQHRLYIRSLEEQEGQLKETGSADSSPDPMLHKEKEMGHSRFGQKRSRDGESKKTEDAPRNAAVLGKVDIKLNAVLNKSSVFAEVKRECSSLQAKYQGRASFSRENSVVSVPLPSYLSMTAPTPIHSGGYHLCSVCLLPASYKCVRCRRALFCSIECHVTHEATRCMKFIV